MHSCFVRKTALENLHIPDAPCVQVFDQAQPGRSWELRVPKAFRHGAESRGKVTREAVLLWLSNQLRRQVTDIGIVHEARGAHPAVLVFFSDKDILDEGTPFEQGVRVVVCCNGAPPQLGVLSRLCPLDKRRELDMYRSQGSLAKSSSCVIA
ncbi:unnamed protein product [Polarella glacialis]|uniref:Uncharacterized protein n=1 Tax=Polarella glacialis TaxID=89957 RepID=A0A813GZ27_POLGL|nr:unnamed protein product [Polarella glacialis]